MIQSASKLLQRIPAHKPVVRNNWGFRVCDWLDLSTRQSEAYQKLLHQTASSIQAEDVGEKIFVRVEHQTLSRLPQSNHIFFTIHTYQSRLKDEVADPQRAKALAAFVKQVPEDLLAYKQMLPIAGKLQAYLAGF